MPLSPAVGSRWRKDWSSICCNGATGRDVGAAAPGSSELDAVVAPDAPEDIIQVRFELSFQQVGVLPSARGNRCSSRERGIYYI